GLADNRRKYPLAKFRSFVEAANRYIQSVGRSKLIDCRVASVLHGPAEYLKLEPKRVPDQVFWDVERLECFAVFSLRSTFQRRRAARIVSSSCFARVIAGEKPTYRYRSAFDLCCCTAESRAEIAPFS